MGKIEKPNNWNNLPNTFKIWWIQNNYGKYKYSEEYDEDVIDGLKEDTPEEIIKEYNELCAIVEELQNKGYDVN